ncbi:MAG: DNA mismatch repair protein MutS [Thermodesulfobacteriota bacterium]
MTQMTPMLRQYKGIKDEFPDAILFFRMGDFYEMFFDDAQVASKILGITLTARGTLNGRKVPMCGIPYHASRAYIGKLVKNGCKVAICEQTGDPKSSKGVVKREVVRLVTPGSVVDEQDGAQPENLYMAALSSGHGRYGLAHVDLSTGDFRVTEVQAVEQLSDEVGRINPAELLIPQNDPLVHNETLSPYRIEVLTSESFAPSEAEALLKEQLEVGSLTGFGCQDMSQGIIAAGALVYYVRETQKRLPPHIKEIVSYQVGDFMALDEPTVYHLELLRTMRRQSVKGSLFHILDKSVTPMGSRLLKHWITYPLVNLDRIRERLAAVACFKEAHDKRADVREMLKEVYDIGRLNGRIALRRANARDLLALKTSVLRLPLIQKALEDTPSSLLTDIVARLDTLEDVAVLIHEAIHDDPPTTLKEGGIIKEGYDETLDRLIAVSRGGKSWISEFASTEKKRTGISSLKVGFNKVFGYYIEVSKPNLHLVPSDYIRKQTLVNGERYITEALKAKEGEVLGAEEKRVQLEHEIFERVREQVAGENRRIKETADFVSRIDVLAGLAEAAEINEYSSPHMEESADLEIRDGRHPVVELSVKNEDFVPNDIQLDSEKQQLMIITGPNMAGKSTILRQTALTVLMAQMGSFVPASQAVIGIVDRIFTRVGASDDLARGQSTFMVEMNETANILRHASPKSLVVLDEIGRGTSTYDGLSIAWAVAEALHDKEGKGVRTLFATHYHELTELVASKPRVKNFNIAVREWNDQIVFLRKLVPGGTSRSYGIQVARIAGLPEAVIRRAMEILNNLEGETADETGMVRMAHVASQKTDEAMVQLDLFGARDRELRQWIRRLNIDSMTPLDALVELGKLKTHVASEGT